MPNSLKSEFLISAGLILLVLALLDPFMVLMPGSLAMTVIAVLAALFFLYAIFIWREKVRDEREELIRMKAGRLAWLAGASILTIGVIGEAMINHSVDAWLIAALTGMIFTKLAARIYAEKNN